MTIKIIERPDHGHGWWHLDTGVKTVTEREVVYHDGSTAHKNYFAKIEILSLMDEPEDYVEADEFFHTITGVRGEFVNPHEGFPRMSDAEFESLEHPRHL